MIHKAMENTGFVLMMLGVGSMDSPVLTVPLIMVSVGVALLAVAAKRAEK